MVGSVQSGMSPTVRGRVSSVWSLSYCAWLGLYSLVCLLLCVVGSVQFGMSPTVRGRVCTVWSVSYCAW